MANAALTIGEVAARTGLSVSAIRFYEEKGLVHPGRNTGGQRRFIPADIRRLSFVLIAQQLGFSIAQIKAQIDSLPNGRTPTKGDWLRLGKNFRQDIEARIAGLQSLRDRLDGCIGCGCLSLKTCKLYNPDDAAAARGAGPRYLMGDRPDQSAR